MQNEPHGDPLFSFNHFLMVMTILVPFLVFWWDTRRQNGKMHAETQKQNWEMHTQNKERLTAIETKINPLWEWWNNNREGNR